MTGFPVDLQSNGLPGSLSILLVYVVDARRYMLNVLGLSGSVLQGLRVAGRWQYRWRRR
jgi:hypothetical protein